MRIKGTSGGDVLVGTSGDDLFNLRQGGDDYVQGGGGHDLFAFGASFTAADRIDGGDGSDTVFLDGNYGATAAPFALGAASLTSVEVLRLGGGHNYDLVSSDANVATGATLIVNAAALSVGDSIVFDGSAETDGHFRFVSSNATGRLTGGANRDVFLLDGAKTPFCDGGGGDDVFVYGPATRNVLNGINGGSGEDTLILDGVNDPALFLEPQVERIVLEGATYGAPDSLAQLYDINDGNARLRVDGSRSDGMFIETQLIVSAGVSVTGGAGDDLFYANEPSGNIYFDGGGGSNTFEILPLAGKTRLSHLSNVQNLIYKGEFNSSLILSGDPAAGGRLSVQVESGSASTVLDLSRCTCAGYDITGGDGYDTIVFGSNLSPTDRISGGPDTTRPNTLRLVDGLGDPSGQLFEFGTGMLTNIDRVRLTRGQDYGMQFDSVHNSLGPMTIDARMVPAGDALRITGSNLLFEFTGNYSAGFDLSGGSGNTLMLGGNYGVDGPLILSAAHLAGISNLTFANRAYDYDIATADDLIAPGATFTVTTPRYTSQFRFDGSAETDGKFDIRMESFTGNLTLIGGQGDDTFEYAAGPNMVSLIDGGGGDNTLRFAGQLDTSHGISNIDTFDLVDRAQLTLVGDPTGTGGASVILEGSGTIDASRSSVPVTVTERGSSPPACFFTGSPGDDVVYLQTADPAYDDFLMTYKANAQLDGGGGYNTLYLGGVSDFTGPNWLENFQKIVLIGDSRVDTNLWLSGYENVARLLIDATWSVAPVILSDPAGGIDYIGGATGVRSIDTGPGYDTIDLSANSLGAVVHTGSGADVITLDSAGDGTVGVDPTSGGYATVHNVVFGTTVFDFYVNGIDPAIATGALSTATFVADLQSAVGAGQLGAHHALLFTPDSGTLASRTFLVLDQTGTPGYRAATDIVIDVTGFTGVLSLSDF